MNQVLTVFVVITCMINMCLMFVVYQHNKQIQTYVDVQMVKNDNYIKRLELDYINISLELISLKQK